MSRRLPLHYSYFKTAYVNQNISNGKTISKLEESGAAQALDFWNRSRAYPAKDIPKDKFMKAFAETKKSMNEITLSGKDVAPWEAKGPLNIPGRTISLAVNPQNSNTLYAGAATGGLWRKYDPTSGGGWERVVTGFPTLGVMAIAIDPNDSLKMFIGTGETYGYQQSAGGYVWRTSRGSYGIGILKTIDGGASWTKSLDWSFDQRRGIQDIKINPLNANTIFAATSEGVYRSYDAGENWTKVLTVEMAEDIIINSNDTSKVLISSGNLGSADAGIYRSADGGDSWDRVNSLPDFSGKTLMDEFKANPDVVFADLCDSLSAIGLYKTTDFGLNWNRVNSVDVASYQGFFAHWVAVHPEDENRIVQAGVQIYKSSNGGTTLSTVTGPHVDHHNFAHDPNNPDILYIACDGGVYRSTNFGSSYTDIGYGLQTSQFYNGFSSSYTDGNFALGGLQDNNTAVFSGGMSWTRVIGGDGSWSAVNANNDDIVYGSSQNGNILRSINGGATFSNATSGLYGDAAFIAPYVISESNPNILYAGRTAVFKTENGGSSWGRASNDLDGNEILSMAISATDPNYVCAGTAPVVTRSHIYKTENGTEWIDVTQDLPDRYPMDIAIDPNDKETIYAVFGGYGTGHIYKSVNGGASWTDITGTLADVPTLSVAIDPLNSDYVYVGSDLGVFVSSDGGAAWNAFNDGLPEATMAMDLNISRANRNLWVATHGNGAYRRPLIYNPEYLISVKPFNVPSSVLVNGELSFSAFVANEGTFDQTENYEIEANLYSPSGENVFTDAQVFCCLGAGESQTINFETTAILSELGDYVFELVGFGNANFPATDTIRQTITTFEAATIVMAEVEKIYKKYEPIGGGSSFNGDDVQRSVSLPFEFEYDGYVYDKAQMSTNGWLEFGTGTNGSERGLSTADQIGNIGANQNGALASTARPTKALGPWWEDLNADQGGVVRYETLGAAPERVFVVQWENMRAYYDASVTTRVNFQVRLYEGSDKIEFIYGDVAEGTFSGADIGAMIGFKDHIGGSYHFYDIPGGGGEEESDIVTDLSPLTDWPGKDSAYVIRTTITGVDDEENQTPSGFVLYQNYPNPFNPATTIKYEIPEAGFVTLKIYDVLGREVAALVNAKQTAGRYETKFDAQELSSGIYIYRIQAGTFTESKKMILLK
ncbi:MAG: T9SS type A sorting domain-containing protein [Chlorobi bacterium]|nr:T9SS type A sorting domain-containing protein [Chlorobiota bacterium]